MSKESQMPALEIGDQLLFFCHKNDDYVYFMTVSNLDTTRGDVVLNYGNPMSTWLQMKDIYARNDSLEEQEVFEIVNEKKCVGEVKMITHYPSGFIHNGEYFDLDGNLMCRDYALMIGNELSAYNMEKGGPDFEKAEKYPVMEKYPALISGDKILFENDHKKELFDDIGYKVKSITILTVKRNPSRFTLTANDSF